MKQYVIEENELRNFVIGILVKESTNEQTLSTRELVDDFLKSRKPVEEIAGGVVNGNFVVSGMSTKASKMFVKALIEKDDLIGKPIKIFIQEDK